MLDLVGPMVGANYHGSMIGFERGGAHGSDEQWDARDTRVQTGLGLLVDNNRTFSVCWCMMITWVRDPLYPSFYSLRG
jgi:hypothetical protein